MAYLVLFVMLWRCIYRGRFNTFYSLCLGMRLVWGEASLGSGNEASLGSGNEAGMPVIVHWL